MERKATPQPLSNCCKAVIVLYVLLAIVSVIVVIVLLTAGSSDSPPVRLGCRSIVGTADKDTSTYSFLGIRYGEPPVGEKRWKEAEATPSGDHCPSDSIEKMRADTKPEACYQKHIMHTGDISGSEDCLFLNVFLPQVALDVENQTLPVLFWIHGGYLQFGDPYSPGWNPDHKAAAGMGVVIVSIQYRLGPFGFLVTDTDNGTGNYGFLDQVLALQWIQENIHKFGGDPNHVTIAGLSSGGASVLAHLVSPRSKGLFHKAIAISGPIFSATLEQARQQNRFFLNKTGCSDINCLRNLKAEEVMNGIYPEWDIYKDSIDLPIKGHFLPALLVVNGEDLPLTMFEAWDQNKTDVYSDVPVVIGTVTQETAFEVAPGTAVKSWTSDDLQEYVASRLDDFDPTFTNITLYDLYAPAEGDPGKDAEFVLVSMISDVKVNCGMDRVARKMSSALSSPVYRYVVTHPPSTEAHPFGLEYPAVYPFHGWDVYAWFSTPETITIMDSMSEKDKLFFDNIKQNMKAFVLHNEPQENGSWKPYPETTAMINETVTVISSDYHARQCQWWNDNHFSPYSWSN